MGKQTDQRELDARLGRAWHDDRRYLLGVGVRMLGSVADAEDAVQEAFTRLVEHRADDIDDVRAWLTVVVTRICIDRLRSADRLRRRTADPQTLEPYATPDVDPADRVTLDDQVRLALHVVMTRLTAAERVAFVLHDIFGHSFESIAEIVGRTPAACRQLASRARRGIDPPGRHRQGDGALAYQVAERFIAACSDGNLEGMLALMDPDCSSDVDIGVAVGETIDLPGYGRRRHHRPTPGREAMARAALRFNGPGSGITLLALPGAGGPLVVGLHGRRVVIFIALTLRRGLIVHGDVVLDPAKLAVLDRVLAP